MFGYWVGLIPRTCSHFILPMIWERSPRKAILIPFRVDNFRKTIIWSFGGAAAAAISITSVYFLIQSKLDPDQIRQGVNEFYEINIPMYLAVGFVISFINPLMEEFFWRGFLFRKYREHGGGIWVGLLFALHHWVIFRDWFEPIPLWISLFSLAGVGLLFNCLYQKTGNLWACLTTHCAADITIIVIGYFILF